MNRLSHPISRDDPEAAQKVTSALSHKQSRLKRVLSTQERLDDIEVLVGLANEEGRRRGQG